MDEALLLIQAYQTWIYAVLALAFVLYARSAIFWWRLYDRSEFGLERERARRRITRAGVMGGWVVLVAGMTFPAATVLRPAVPHRRERPIGDRVDPGDGRHPQLRLLQVRIHRAGGRTPGPGGSLAGDLGRHGDKDGGGPRRVGPEGGVPGR